MAEPYESQKIPDHWNSSPKRAVLCRIVAISGLRLKQRDTWLMHPRTRTFPKFEIAEMTITDEELANPGHQINSVLYIGFLEVQQGGVVIAGDSVSISEKEIGVVGGFSDIHEPNHLNIMVKGNPDIIGKYITPYSDASVVKLDFNVEDEVVFGRHAKK
ncbi:MAG: DUF6917 domain-containing protein [Candidatus Thorarchaeota archaeon]